MRNLDEDKLKEHLQQAPEWQPHSAQGPQMSSARGQGLRREALLAVQGTEPRHRAEGSRWNQHDCLALGTAASPTMDPGSFAKGPSQEVRCPKTVAGKVQEEEKTWDQPSDLPSEWKWERAVLRLWNLYPTLQHTKPPGKPPYLDILPDG